MKSDWEIKKKDASRKCVDEVIRLIEDLDPEEGIGMIAAQEVIDAVLENLGPEIYNKATEDIRAKLAVQFTDIDTEIDLMRKQS